MSSPAAEDRQSVILLGASNLTMGWKPVLKALQSTVPGPLDIRVSLGMGRSYVDWSSFWLRRLPGIVDCGLWDSLPSAGARPPLVLVTDLGNDIVYMHDPDRIFQAVTECIQRIQHWRPDAKIVLTGLPLCALRPVDTLRFVIARTILFPRCLMPFKEILNKAETLDEMVQKYAADNHFPFVIPQAEWYRADPIHVIAPLREKVFRQFFSHWKTEVPATVESRTLPRAGLPSSAVKTFAGFECKSQQPVFNSPELVVSAW